MNTLQAQQEFSNFATSVANLNNFKVGPLPAFLLSKTEALACDAHMQV